MSKLLLILVYLISIGFTHMYFVKVVSKPYRKINAKACRKLFFLMCVQTQVFKSRLSKGARF